MLAKLVDVQGPVIAVHDGELELDVEQVVVMMQGAKVKQGYVRVIVVISFSPFILVKYLTF